MVYEVSVCLTCSSYMEVTYHVNNNVTVGELGERLGNDSLAASECTGNAHGTTLYTREQSVEDTLTDDKRSV
jgi:hypothetical protein